MNWCHIYIDVHFSSFFWLPHSLAYTLTRLNSLPLYEKDRGTPKQSFKMFQYEIFGGLCKFISMRDAC